MKIYEKIFNEENNLIGFKYENEFEYIGEWDEEQNPYGTGTLRHIDGNVIFEGFFDNDILYEKIKEYRNAK